MKCLPLSQGKSTQVSACDFGHLSQFKWSLHLGSRKNRKEKWYARRSPQEKLKRKRIYMHRYIVENLMKIKIPDGHVVDHIDNDGLNNQRENLRVLTHAENTAHCMFKSKCEPWL